MRKILHLVVMTLALGWGSASWAAYYLACSTSCVNGAYPPGSSYRWIEVGTYPPQGMFIYQNGGGGVASVSYLAWNYVGTVTYAAFCSNKAPDGYQCLAEYGTASSGTMVVSPPVTCVPAGRTIDPCPSGYAPSQVDGNQPTVGDAYSSAFEKLPVQDLLYGIGIALCGLLGVGVGTRLV